MTQHTKAGALILLVSALALLVACRTTNTSATVDRHNPEAVLRAYFDAFARNDVEAQKSFMTSKYANLVREPVASLTILSITPNADVPANTRAYIVSFEIKFKGRGFSMEDGRHQWSYTLTWDRFRDSWLISNYGSG